MVATHFVWDPIEDNIIRELDAGGNVVADYTSEPTHFGNISSQAVGGQVTEFSFDGSGNTIAATDSEGDVTDTFEYSAFGNVSKRTGGTQIPYQFGGQKGYFRLGIIDSFSIRRREMTGGLGRWKSKDQGFADGINLFLYATNNPVSRIDPSGLLTEQLARQPTLLPCGAYVVEMQWKLDADERDGYIIQQVISRRNGQKCTETSPPLQDCDPPKEHQAILDQLEADNILNTNRCGPKGYFELWTVDRAGMIYGRTTDPVTLGDTDTFTDYGYSSPSKGDSAKYGVAIFIPRSSISTVADTTIINLFVQGSTLFPGLRPKKVAPAGQFDKLSANHFGDLPWLLPTP